MRLRKVDGRPMGQRDVGPDKLFRIFCYTGSDTVQRVTCSLCGDNLFDDAKDKDLKANMLTKAAVLHLNLAHGINAVTAEPRRGG